MSAPVQAELDIRNKRGLHARAAAKFVRLAGEYDARVEVEKDNTCVDGTSIMGLMMLAASIGATITVRATGAQAEDAVAALSELVNRKFDEE